MKKIGIAKIKINNPVLASYTKRIRSWDEGNNFEIVDNHFYAVFLEDEFLGASTMDFNPETSSVNILMINGSTQNYERIQEESTKQLTDIALAKYQAKEVKVNNVKKIGVR